VDGVFLTSCRVEAFRGIEPSEEARRVISLLGIGEACGAVDNFTEAMSAALWHDSYLYENRGEAPGLTAGVLSALEALGKTWLARELTLLVIASRHDAKPGTLSRTVHIARQALALTFPQRAKWARDGARFGRSLSNHQPPSVHLRIVHQVLGLVCLTGGAPSLAGYLTPLLRQALDSAESETDWVTLLQQTLAGQRMHADWSYSASGPDHQRSFAATCRVGRLTSKAEGASKKAARWGAARLMLQEHFPRALEEDSGAVSPPQAPVSVPRGDNAAFARAVPRIASEFGFGVSATPLLAQAFLHTSWIYENQNEARRARQRDHGVLGFIGSQILDFESSLAETLTEVCAPSDVYAHRTLEISSEVEALHLLGVESAIMLGRGQASNTGVTREIASSTFQGLIAALHLSAGRPRSVFEAWPTSEPWAEVREIIAPGTAQAADDRTLLQEFAAPCGLEVSYDFEREGPDHDVLYTAVVILVSPVLRRRLRVRGPAAAGKTMALRGASAIVIRWARALNDPTHLAQLATANDNDLAGTSFLLSHLCEVAATLSVVRATWRRQGLLGSSLQTSDLARWAEAADAVMRMQTKVHLDAGSLTEYFRALAGVAGQGLPLAPVLTRTLEWAAKIDPSEPIDAREHRRLVDLAAAYRCLGGEQGPVSLADMVEGQMLLSRGRLENDASAAVVGEVPASMAAAFESVASLMLMGGRRVQVATSGADEVALRWLTPGGDAAELSPTVEVWRAVGVPLVLDELLSAVRFRLPVETRGDAGPISLALRQAQTPQPSPLASAVANLLHDLKNQVAAADVLASAPDDGSRTARLERELAASRHLDQAAALAERIRAASSLLSASDVESTSLSTFLRRYAAAMLVRLPAVVSLDVGAGDEGLAVAMSEPALTAVLDNLIKNAVEAMPGGGRIRLDWTYDEDVAVVEITDDGPGLPESVRAALEAGGRVDSTKPGGNGLGLLGVRALLRRVGGNFELARSTAGTVWHLTIPLTEERG
jgi:signal transduction histidine kinase/dsRNA-specific ribonuclease